ncbi:protein mono-ADP-ribosyltransferase PARP14-like isoform X3 [Ostrea edulis]|uniref:protein mono-ADP-ribosyltransferase PARP14-like isoform X3 n=1 Tax=Ostrea edulis TaxID=37623 RepID=UPI0024AF84D0|nr:protein mono-ADP-ribosyltransferase PARP14-like isoform X3 [Ostrea edulis]
MIKVTNIPPDTSWGSLLFVFENRRKSGGGSIKELEYDPDTQSAVITFEDPAAVERVLGKVPILFSGKQIGVEEFRPNIKEESTAEEPDTESENVLEVRGVSSSTSSDTVEMYFENTRCSGGGDIKQIIREADVAFYIIFEEEGVMENVLRKKHKIEGTAIEVCRYVPPPPPKPVPMYSNKFFIKTLSGKTTKDGLEIFPEATTNIMPSSIEYGELEGTALVTFEENLEVAMIKVTNIPPDTSEDSLLFFFENRRKSGGGSIKELEYDPDTQSAVITFEDPAAVERVLGKVPILFSGKQIGVEEFRPNIKEESTAEEPDTESENVLEVRGVSSSTSSDTVEMYFENTRCSGGGDIKQIIREADVAFYIIFEEEGVMENVLRKKHKIEGTAIEVCRYVPPPPPKPVPMYSNKFFIKTLSGKTTKDGLEIFPEATTNIMPSSIEYGELEGTALVTFEENLVMETVLRKKHKIEGTAIEVCRYVPPPPPKPVPMYPNKVFIKNLSDKTTKDGVENFLEAKTSTTPTSIEYGELEGTALVTFDENLDFEKLQLACKKRSLYKSHLEVCPVPVTNCVIVRNVSEITSRDSLEFYFDNEKRSGVTGVLDVKMYDGFGLVYFEEPEAVEVVCAKSHRVDGQDLEVKIYYECLGQVESDEEGPFQPPGLLELTDLDTKKLQFLMKSPPNQEAVQKQLEVVYGKPVWPTNFKVNSLSIECTLTAETKDCRKICRIWEAKVKENMNKFLDLLLVIKHTTLKEAFPLVLNELKSLTISNPDAVAVILERNNHEMYVTGHKQASTEVSKQISDIIQKVDEELDRTKTR